MLANETSPLPLLGSSDQVAASAVLDRGAVVLGERRLSGKGAVSTATALAAPFTYVALASSIGPEGGSGIWAAA